MMRSDDGAAAAARHRHRDELGVRHGAIVAASRRARARYPFRL